jgi:hypothetical protein
MAKFRVASWYKVTVPGAEAGAAGQRINEALTKRLEARARIGEDTVGVFRRQDGGETVDFYLSPAAGSILADVIVESAGVQCSQPERKNLVLLLGSWAALDD